MLNPFILKHQFSLLFILIVFPFFSFAPHQQINTDSIIGNWKTKDGKGIIQIYKNADKYQGKIIWLKEPNDPKTGKPQLDIQHPDKQNHNRPVLGLVNMWGFKYSAENEWSAGKIYDPESGKTYSCKLSLSSTDKLKVRGYVGVAALGRTETWTRE
jgi:uncharacterized protein (DUF2147 family)